MEYAMQQMDLMAVLIGVITILAILLICVLYFFIKEKKAYEKYKNESSQELVKAKDEVLAIQDKMYSQQIATREEYQQQIDCLKKHMEQMEIEHIKDKDKAKQKSLNLQRNTVKGQIAEMFVPFMDGFKYEAADCRFMGQPVDYVVFENLHKYEAQNCGIEDVRIVFLEIKTGNAKLSKRQEVIRDAITKGKVLFKVMRVQEDKSVLVEESIDCGKNKVSKGDDHQEDEKELIEMESMVNGIVIDPSDALARASEKWTNEEDAILIQSFKKGLDYRQLAQIHQRTHGAIASRLKKLGVIQ